MHESLRDGRRSRQAVTYSRAVFKTVGYVHCFGAEACSVVNTQHTCMVDAVPCCLNEPAAGMCTVVGGTSTG